MHWIVLTTLSALLLLDSVARLPICGQARAETHRYIPKHEDLKYTFSDTLRKLFAPSLFFSYNRTVPYPGRVRS